MTELVIERVELDISGRGGRGPQGNKGDTGGNAQDIGLFTALSSPVIPSVITRVTTSGYNATGVGSATYVYDPTVNSAEVAAHPRCCFLASDGRGFRLPLNGTIIPFEAFGAVADDNDTTATDSYSAFQAMQAYGVAHAHRSVLGGLDYASSIPFPVSFNGWYYSSLPWSLHGCHSWIGFGSHSPGGGAHPVRIRFPADSHGIIINDYNTDGDQGTAPNAFLSAAGTLIQGITVLGGGGTDRTKHGIWVRTKCTIRDFGISSFPGNLLNVVGTFGTATIGTDTTTGNCNSAIFENASLNGGGKFAVYVDGADANSALFKALNVIDGSHGGFVDASFLGNGWPDCNVHNSGQLGKGGVTFGGNRYDLISFTDGAGASTTPGTNSSIWYPIGAGAVDGRHPAWSGSDTYYFSGGMLMGDSANARCGIFNPYIETGLNLSHAGSSCLVVAPNINTAWTNHTPMTMVPVGAGGAVSSPVGMGYYKASKLTPGSFWYASVGEAETGTENQVDTILTSAGTNRQQFRLKHVSSGGYITADFANTSSTQAFRYHSSVSTEQFGTGVAVPYVFHILKFALGSATPRIIDMLSAVPGSGTHAAGELVFNSSSGTTVKAWAWRNNTLGTPGTWDTMYRRLYGSTTWDPASVAAGGNTTTTITVTGAATGDIISSCDFGGSIQPLVKNAWVSGSNTVTVELLNLTAGAVDLGSMTVKVEVTKQ